MSGAIPLLPQYTFMEWSGTALSFTCTTKRMLCCNTFNSFLLIIVPEDVKTWPKHVRCINDGTNICGCMHMVYCYWRVNWASLLPVRFSEIAARDPLFWTLRALKMELRSCHVMPDRRSLAVTVMQSIWTCPGAVGFNTIQCGFFVWLEAPFLWRILCVTQIWHIQTVTRSNSDTSQWKNTLMAEFPLEWLRTVCCGIV